MARPKEIIDGLLYMSSSPGKWRPVDKRDEWLEEHGIKHVVALCNRSPEVLDVSHGGSIDVMHLPVVDSHKTVDPRIPQYVLPHVLQWVRDGEPTLVSCLAGRSRSGITCGLVLRGLYDLSGAEALEKLRERRPNAIKREGPARWLSALPRPSDEDTHDLPEEFFS